MSRAVIQRLGPSPTPITEYMATHPEVSLMSLAKAANLHYDTVFKAERGEQVPRFSTMVKLQQAVGIPVMAWAGTRAVRLELESKPDHDQYNRKQNAWRKKKRAEDPAYHAKEAAKFKRSDERKAARKRGEEVPPVPRFVLGAGWVAP